MNDERHLYIPVNVQIDKQYMTGFGNEEVKVIGIGIIIGLIIGFIVYLITGTLPLLMITATVVVAITVSLVAKDQYNENMLSRIKLIYQFGNRQKRYEYEYSNIYED